MTRLVLVLVCAFAAPAFAEEPWAQGVPAATQAKANALFAEGNQLFAERAHAPALEKYKQAIAMWDHPMIRFNMAVTLIRLDRVLDAADELEKALRFGAKPFTAELYQQALDYQSLVKKQLGFIEIKCDQPDTHIQLDGKPWFDAPGTKTVRVLAGEHAIVADRKGYLTESRRLVVGGGATINHTLKLVPLESAVILEYRHPRWLPWTVAITGAAVAGGGLGAWLLGKSRMDDFAQEFVKECPNGCDLAEHPGLRAEQDRAELEGKIGVSAMIGGGAIAVTGVVWVLVNRPVRRLPRVEVQPTASGVTASAGWRF